MFPLIMKMFLLPAMIVFSAVPERIDVEINTEISFLEGIQEDDLEGKDMLELRGLFNILGTFDLCLLSCNGRSCGCCHRLLSLISICGSSYIDPTEKTVELSLKLAGRRIYKIKTPLDKLEHICGNMTVDNIGNVGVCVNTSLSAHSEHPDSFRICVDAEVQLNQVRVLQITVNCLEFSGDVIFEGKDGTDGKKLASVRILNPLLLANEIRKMITNRIFGK